MFLGQPLNLYGLAEENKEKNIKKGPTRNVERSKNVRKPRGEKLERPTKKRTSDNLS